jgi:hypothetical protein
VGERKETAAYLNREFCSTANLPILERIIPAIDGVYASLTRRRPSDVDVRVRG